MAGFGNQPYGTTPYGLGTPAVADATGGSIMRDDVTGETHGSLMIDPLTRDYVLDEHGRRLGMPNVRQLVQLAVSTVRGSAAMRELGHKLGEIDRITRNIHARVRHALTAAVQHLVDRDLIEVRGVRVAIARPGVVVAALRWRDLTTESDEQETETTLGNG